jgi:steroid 5-alpha reductase family enzyme
VINNRTEAPKREADRYSLLSTDFGGSINFLLLAFLTLFLGNEANFVARNILASVFVMLWSIRLGGFLFFRVLKTGKDGRFDEMRAHFFKFAGFWAFQLFWVRLESVWLDLGDES